MSNPIRDPYSRVTRPELFEDFQNTSMLLAGISGTSSFTTASGTFYLQGTGTPTCLSIQGGVGSPGAISLNTSAAANDTAILTWHTNLSADDVEFFEVRYQIPTATGSTNMLFQAGLLASVAVPFGSPSRSVLYNTATDGNLHSVSFQGSANDVSLGAIQATNTWNTARIAFPTGNGGFSSTQRYAATGNGATARADHTANMITAGTAFTGFTIAVKTLAASARGVFIDYVRLVPKEINRGGYLP